MTESLHALLDSLIDYAGLFPPAALDMRTAITNYAQYKSGPHAWMLGRFILPVARFSEFEPTWSGAGRPAGWHLSALVARPEIDLPLIEQFNRKHGGALQVDAIEAKVSSPDQIRALPAGSFVEVPIADETPAWIDAIRAANLRAKIRTGGLTQEMFPPAATIAQFLSVCAAHGVAFKATAGLHHPVRCMKPFTYAPDSPRGVMHGFLNVFLAAAFARAGKPASFLEQLLLDEDSAALRFTDTAIGYRDAEISTADILETRRDFAIAFGSCSFEEPIADLQSLGLLP